MITPHHRYGEVALFEQQLNYPLTQLSDTRLNERVLQDVDMLILPQGYYGNLFDHGVQMH